MKIETKIKKKWMILLLLLLLVLGTAGAYYWYNSQKNPKELIAGDYPDIKDAKKMTNKELKDYQQKKVDETQFTLTIFPEATFDQKTSEGNIYIKNEPVNAYPINVRVILDKDKSLVYESGMIQPGYEVTKAKLDKPLEAGTYKATAQVDIYDSKLKEKRGTTQAVIEITVNK
ncbi:hypothetical protein ACWOC1_14385 [Enterococcus quebecensis]|uniref:Uncharacterized protein n=1 Tax=Enterococcus quebecensis TaxID=903983 RepID=A0A1E5GUJ0_9ENTE|nr:hypothetical protein [Enterococcus quebecensis]OEG16329.1 hypothetical protein BCR23_05420 [Enterococcus quebecensis]OJG70443.1 hypothetical protein RV12_GL001927 [Enterococcus quebecensis]